MTAPAAQTRRADLDRAWWTRTAVSVALLLWRTVTVLPYVHH